MNKHTVITIITIIIIIIPFAHSGLNIYAAEQIKFKWTDENTFSFFEMSNSGKFEFCNSLPITTNFNQLEITPFYQDDAKGTIIIPASNIEPGKSNIFHGTFKAEQFSTVQSTLIQIDAQFNGVSAIRLDPNAFFVIVTIDTPIIGIIPYTTTITHTGFDFSNMMNEDLVC